MPMSEFEALAKNVVRRTLRVRPKENVIVECWNHGLDAAREIVYQLRSIGARSTLLFEDEQTYWRGVETLPTGKLGQVSSSEWAALAKADAYIFLPGPADIARYRKNLPKSQAATAYNSEWYRRAEKAGLRGARVLLGYVTRERAASYGFEFEPWRAMLVRATSADFGPIARKGKKLATLLSKEAEVEITAPNGTRLTLELSGREARTDDGIVDAQDLKAGHFMTNVPPGYVIVSPDESTGEGIFRADRPAPYLGSGVMDVAFEFHAGHAEWTASANSELVRSQYERAKGAKDRVGTLSIGINPEASYGYLQDDLVAGCVEVSIGDNSEEDGRNRSDFGLGGRLSRATVRVGKRVIVDGGRLVV